MTFMGLGINFFIHLDLIIIMISIFSKEFPELVCRNPQSSRTDAYRILQHIIEKGSRIFF